MSDTLGPACRDLGVDLHGVLQSLDPARYRADTAALLRARLTAMAGRARALREMRAAQTDADLVQWLGSFEAEAATVLDVAPDRFGARRARTRLAAAYDALSRQLRARALEVPRNRPTNYLRNAYHLANGLFSLWLILHILTPTGRMAVAGGMAAFAWTCELLRHNWPPFNPLIMKLFNGMSHPDEVYRINSATWMCTGLVVLALSFDAVGCAAGVAVAGFADPVAALVGRRWGRIRLAGARTLAGSTAFVVVGTVVVTLVFALYGPPMSLGTALVLGLSAAIPAAAVELWAPLDDNLSVPVTAALCAFGARLICGLPVGAGWLAGLGGVAG
ncbi:MAG: hypothetical protein EXR79_14515 [Myxococcales bacterium]|nr:hypothetical protein [Myxococcales bacterium]